MSFIWLSLTENPNLHAGILSPTLESNWYITVSYLDPQWWLKVSLFKGDLNMYKHKVKH